MKDYRPRNAMLTSLQDSMLAPALRSALDDKALDRVVREVAPGIVEFELFTEDACGALLRELHAFEHWRKRTGFAPTRPNSMNAHGVVLSELALQYAMDDLLARCVAPIAQRFLSEHEAHPLDHQHAFVVEYFEGGDRSLGFHVDDSELTLNACLGWEFDGSEVYFEGTRCDAHREREAAEGERWSWAPKPGRAIVHAGANRHGVRALTSGRRTNLIVWARSSRHRRTREAPQAGPSAWCIECEI